jgi:hypothetical protein
MGGCLYQCPWHCCSFRMIGYSLHPSSSLWGKAGSLRWKRIFFFVVLGLELKAFTLSPIFCDRAFWDRVSWTTCLGWLQTAILLISPSWVARITGVRHWHPAKRDFLCLWWIRHERWPWRGKMERRKRDILLLTAPGLFVKGGMVTI